LKLQPSCLQFSSNGAAFGILISILAINTFIGFHEEKKAKDALDGLKNSMVTTVDISFLCLFFFFFRAKFNIPASSIYRPGYFAHVMYY
jgi:hypothetical protein